MNETNYKLIKKVSFSKYLSEKKVKLKTQLFLGNKK